MRRQLAASALVFVCGLAAFARSIAFAFVYDDHWTIENAPLDVPLGRLMSWLMRGVGHAHHIPDETRPAMVASVWIDHALFREAPAGYHADSVLLYGAVCVLAFLACLALTSRLRLSLVAALVFALAPLHAEVVCAINYREDLLASIGVLAAIALLFSRRPASRGSEALALGAFAIGLLAKESAVALVLVAAAAIAIFPRARARALRNRELLFGLIGVLLIWLWWRGALVASGDDVPRAHYASVSARLLAAARFFVRTGVAAVFPVHPAPEYAREAPASALWLVPLVAWVVTVALLARRPSTRVLALGLAIAVLAPLPTSPLFAPANERADRFAFLAVLGGALVWGWVASRVPRRAVIPALAAVGVALSIACQTSAATWRNDRTLWSTATTCAPTSPRAWVGLSRACRLDGDIDEADRAIARAIELDPKFIAAHVTYAHNLVWRGDVEDARRELAIIHELGGDRHRGVAQAAECAALEPGQARVCIR